MRFVVVTTSCVAIIAGSWLLSTAEPERLAQAGPQRPLVAFLGPSEAFMDWAPPLPPEPPVAAPEPEPPPPPTRAPVPTQAPQTTNPPAPAAVASTGDCGGVHWAAAYIYMRESGCNPGAVNPGGCRGIGQACPGSKLPCGNDFACQHEWFTGYAMGRYGSWEAAYNFWLANHWW